MDIDLLKQELTRDEGLELKPYTDTVDKLTIGVGRNLDDRGISEDEAMVLLGNDIAIVEAELDRNAAWWRDLPDDCQRGLANMCFNLGWPRLSGFRNMLAALEDGDYDEAAVQALDSRWARQVKGRADRIADLFRSAAGGGNGNGP